MLRVHLYPFCNDFLVRHNGACVSAYWSNWDIANIGALLAIGVLCDDPAIFDEGVAYFERGDGMGSLPNAIPFLHPAGPWSDFKDIAPPETMTHGSQSTMMGKVVGTRRTTVIFMADLWKPKSLWDSRYLWMPLEIGDGKLWLPKPRPWSLDIPTDDVTER